MHGYRNKAPYNNNNNNILNIIGGYNDVWHVIKNYSVKGITWNSILTITTKDTVKKTYFKMRYIP